MKTKQDKLTLLDETMKAYTLATRCFDKGVIGGSCRYYMPDKIGCAIGRLIPDKDLCRALDRADSSDVRSVFMQLPADLREYGVSFLHKLQRLHDNEMNWDAEGLSPDGKVYAESIRVDVENDLL